MTLDRRFSRAFNPFQTFWAAVAGAAVLSSCSTPPPPPPPALPPALVPPPITLSDSLIQDAAAYQAYMTKVTAITPDFKSGDDVAAALKTGDSSDPQQLLRGSIAYAAIMALQDPEFVTQVQVFAANPVSRPLLTEDILSNPNYVVGLKGVDGAANRVIEALMDQGQKLHTTGEAVKQSAYTIQHQSWSQQLVANRDQRLADAKSVSNTELLSTTEDAARMRQMIGAAAPLTPSTSASPIATLAASAPATTASTAPTPPSYPPVVVRGLALAALAVLGNAGDDQAARIAPLVNETGTAACLGDAKLNLYQCLAVAKPHYEDIFCLGQHVMMDTGQCMMIAAGAPPPVYTPVAQSKTEVAYAPAPTPKKKKRGK